MRTNKSLTTRVWLLAILIAFNALVVQVEPAHAIISDRNVYAKLQTERNRLIVQERELERDYDELNTEIKDLDRSNSDPRLLDQLSRDLNEKVADIKQVRYDIRSIEMRML